MPRKARITVTGAIHHIMSRGIEGRPIFRDVQDRRIFFANLESQLGKTGYLLYAWCLMENHYHLLIRVNEYPLGSFMRVLNSRYAQYFRKKSGTRRYLFQDRYKSIVTQDQHHIAAKISRQFGLAAGEIMKRGKSNLGSETRKACAYTLNRLYDIPVIQIAKFFNISSPAVSTMVAEGERMVNKI